MPTKSNDNFKYAIGVPYWNEKNFGDCDYSNKNKHDDIKAKFKKEEGEKLNEKIIR